MTSSLLLFFVAFQSQLLISVLGQESIGCFMDGECVGSVYLDEFSTPLGDLECLEYCAGVEGSDYFSYDPQTSVSINNHFYARKCFSYNLSFTALLLLSLLWRSECFNVPQLHLW